MDDIKVGTLMGILEIPHAKPPSLKSVQKSRLILWISFV